MYVGLPQTLALRQLALAACVLDDIDLVPDDDGILLFGDPLIHVPWESAATCLPTSRGSAAPADIDVLAGGDVLADARMRGSMSCYLRSVRRLSQADPDAVRTLVRPIGFPTEHPHHPGPGWTFSAVHGDALHVGLGIVGLLGDPDRVDVVLGSAPVLAGCPVDGWEEAAAAYLDRMAQLAAQRFSVDAAGTLRPMGDCDCVTLLGSPRLRNTLVEGCAGLRAVAMPSRRRGWTDIRRIDPAFAAAAARATDTADRGFERLVLVTADEVALAAASDSAPLPEV